MIHFSKIIILILFFTCSYASDTDFDLWNERASSQIKWQNFISDELLKEIPEAKELILLQRDLQITNIELRKHKYFYLVNTHPNRIVRDKGEMQWSNFNWSTEDESELLKSNRNHEKISQERLLLIQKSEGHPMWPKVRSAFKIISSKENSQRLKKN